MSGATIKPLKTATGHHTHFPMVLTSFVGRKREIEEITRRLTSVRVLTLTGTAGCGKTRIALQITSDLIPSYTDGVYWIDLGSLSEGALVARTVATVLGITEQRNSPMIDALVAGIQKKRLLLVLDNCEHLLGACAQLAKTLLSTTPITIFATSREPLGVTGEIRYPILPMPLPSDEVTAGVAQYDAIQLFTERARAILPQFELTSRNAVVVTQICRDLDGIPLAIELASARLNVLTIEQIAARLHDHFALLLPATHLTESKHETLHAAIDWSYALLSVPEQTILRRLSVFVGGCSLTSVEAVCVGEGINKADVLKLIASLVNKSLLTAQTLHQGEARYVLLTMIRQYAQAKVIEADETTLIRTRHLHYFVQVVEETALKLIGPYQDLWLNWLEGEYDNIRSALNWAVEHGNVEDGLRLAIAIAEFWRKRAYAREGLIWLERLFAQTDEWVPIVLHANALVHASLLAMVLGNTATTIDYSRRVITLNYDMNTADKSILVMPLVGLAQSKRASGDYQTAFEIGARVIQLSRDTEDLYRLGQVLIMQAGTTMALGDFAVVQRLLDEALHLARQSGDTYRIAIIFNFLGDVWRCQQQYVRAQAHYEDSIVLLRKLDTERDLASALHNLGHTFLHLGNPERAYANFYESLALQQNQQNMLGIAECLIGFAALAITRNLHHEGVRLLSAALNLGGPRAANVWTATQQEVEYYLALARDSLNDPAFHAETEMGRFLTLEQALDCALKLPLQPQSSTLKILNSLTTREREIVALIALGKTNGDIAAALVVSKRTVEKHIANILSKLDLTTRTQILRWAVQTELVKLTD